MPQSLVRDGDQTSFSTPLAAELGWDNFPHHHPAVKIEAYHETAAVSASIYRRDPR